MSQSADNPTTATWPVWLALIPLLGGLAIGVVALVSSLGIWLGWWDFRKGFQLLQFVNKHAAWITLVCLGATLMLGIAARALAGGGELRVAVLGLIGTLAAGLAYYIPESYRPPEGTPPIHDVSTDTVHPLQFVDILPLRADAPNTVVYGGSPDITPEKLAQMQIEAYPDLMPLHLNASKEHVFVTALAVVDKMGLDLVAQVPEEGRIEATATTFWFRFKDDVVIKITSDGNGTIVNARSLSRVGRGDAGTNARRLRKFFALLKADL